MFAAPFSYTLRGMAKLMEWRAPAEPDSAAGIPPEHTITGVAQSQI